MGEYAQPETASLHLTKTYKNKAYLPLTDPQSSNDRQATMNVASRDDSSGATSRIEHLSVA